MTATHPFTRKILLAFDFDWTLAEDSFERLVVLNMPHPAPLLREVRKCGRQLRRLGYVAAFQIPGLAERLLAQVQGGGEIAHHRLYGYTGVLTVFTMP